MPAAQDGLATRVPWGRVVLVAALFSLLAVALFAPDRGFLQDEPWILNTVRASPDLRSSLFWPSRLWDSQPQRVLLTWPFVLAERSGATRDVLQLQLVLAFFGTALGAAALTRALLGPGTRAMLLATALCASATGDLALNSLSALPSQLSVMAFLLAATALLSYGRSGRGGLLVLAIVCQWASLFMYDACTFAALGLPLLLPFTGAPRRRALLAAAVWWLALLPYLALLVRFVQSSRTHAQALDPFSPGRHLPRALALFGWNFSPWRWAALFERPEWGTLPVALPRGLRLAAAAAAALLGGVALRSLGRAGRASQGVPAGRRCWPQVALLLALAFASNASFATLKDLSLPYRTQHASRVLVSITLAIVLERALRLWPRGRVLALGLTGVFVTLGLDAGLASQDYYLTLWRRHRLELASVLEQVPALRPGTWLVLQVPSGTTALASSATPVVSHWMSYLHPGVPVICWNGRSGHFTCEPEAGGLVCRNPARADCYASGQCQPLVLPLDRIVLMTYAPQAGRFELHPRLPAGLAWAAPAALPEARSLVRPGAPSREARAMLLRPERLARLFPAPDPGLYRPLLHVRDEAVSPDPRLLAPGGLRVLNGQQVAVAAAPGPVVAGRLWSATHHRVRFRLRSDEALADARWQIELRAGANAQADGAGLEVELRPGRNDFTLSLIGAQQPAGLLLELAAEALPD